MVTLKLSCAFHNTHIHHMPRGMYLCFFETIDRHWRCLLKLWRRTLPESILNENVRCCRTEREPAALPCAESIIEWVCICDQCCKEKLLQDTQNSSAIWALRYYFKSPCVFDYLLIRRIRRHQTSRSLCFKVIVSDQEPTCPTTISKPNKHSDFFNDIPKPLALPRVVGAVVSCFISHCISTERQSDPCSVVFKFTNFLFPKATIIGGCLHMTS